MKKQHEDTLTSNNWFVKNIVRFQLERRKLLETNRLPTPEIWRYLNTNLVSSDNREKIKVSLMLVGDVHPSANSKKLKQ